MKNTISSISAPSRRPGRSVGIWAAVASAMLAGCASSDANKSLADVKTGLLQIGASVTERVQGVAQGTSGTPSSSRPETTQAMQSARGEPITKTSLHQIWVKHPYAGTPQTTYPRVALTIRDYPGEACWVSVAKIWWSNTRSELVPEFYVCPGMSEESKRLAAGNKAIAANRQAIGYENLMMRIGLQTANFLIDDSGKFVMKGGIPAVGHTGNVRTDGPLPPERPLPPQADFNTPGWSGFIREFTQLTGYVNADGDATASGVINLWIVRFEPRK